jgi:hypothetical protein
MTEPLYKDEAIIRSVTYSTRGGHKVTFELDPEGWEAFKGRETTRCMMVLVEIDNEGQPAESAPTAPAQKPRRRMSELSRAQQAGILCHDERFMAFLEEVYDVPINAGAGRYEEAAIFVRAFCEIAGRKELNTDDEAWERFEGIRTEFDAYTGKIGRPE